MSIECEAELTTVAEAPARFAATAPTPGGQWVDIPALGAIIGCRALESGDQSTPNWISKICLIDGERGELLYRGYPVEQLAEQCDFLEVAYLLRNGELPNAGRKEWFESTVAKHAPAHEQMVKLYEGFRRDADPVAVMVGVVGALSAFCNDSANVPAGERRSLSLHRIVAKMPAIVAMAYKYSVGLPFMRPRADLGYTANFLYMLLGNPCEEYRSNPLLVRALDAIMILHADCGQDAPTSTLRMAASAGANPFACVSAAIACMSGPARGGGSAACLAMLERIGDMSRVPGFIERAGNADDGASLPGFGQPAGGNADPRAQLVRKLCKDVLKELCLENEPFFRQAMMVEQRALEDPSLAGKRLLPNLDFYSGIVLRALGIPPSMFPCIFALARTAGWVAQWEESLGDAECQIALWRCAA